MRYMHTFPHILHADNFCIFLGLRARDIPAKLTRNCLSFSLERIQLPPHLFDDDEKSIWIPALLEFWAGWDFLVFICTSRIGKGAVT